MVDVESDAFKEKTLELLNVAGIEASVVDIRFASSSYTNRTWIAELDDHRSVVGRWYRWPYGGQPDDARARRELDVYAAVKEAGGASPDVLAISGHGDDMSILMSYVPGQELGEMSASATDAAPLRAWYEAGRSLRRLHSAVPPNGETCGHIVDWEVVPFEGGMWSEYHRRSAAGHVAALGEAGKTLPEADIDSLFVRAARILDERPRALLHNDAHPWNVRVACTPEDGWSAVWIDVEFACVGDPAWDLVRFHMFRVRDIGPTPPAFALGYGWEVPTLISALYELHVSLWLHRQCVVDGDDFLQPSYDEAAAYVHDLPARLQRLDEMLSEGGG